MKWRTNTVSVEYDNTLRLESLIYVPIYDPSRHPECPFIARKKAEKDTPMIVRSNSLNIYIYVYIREMYSIRDIISCQIKNKMFIIISDELVNVFRISRYRVNIILIFFLLKLIIKYGAAVRSRPPRPSVLINPISLRLFYLKFLRAVGYTSQVRREVRRRELVGANRKSDEESHPLRW